MAKFKILKNEQFGRYMVASRNIKAGELILSETPVLIGPQYDGDMICFNCCRNINRGYIYCRQCEVAVICGPKCTGKIHTDLECEVFKKLAVQGKVLAINYQIVFPLRCILLREYNPEIWHEILQLEPHLESRRHTMIWRRYKNSVEDIIKTLGVLRSDDDCNETVQRICGILDINTFEVRPACSKMSTITNPEKQCLRGLYLTAALMAHDCIGNTLLSADDNFLLTIKASIDIPENTPIFFNYSNTLQGTTNRREHLHEGKYFDCFCQRCNDSTELGTEISSLKCHKCNQGWIRLKQPNFDVQSDWQCSNCLKMFKNCLINSTVEEGRRRIEEIDTTNIFDMETIFRTLLQTFHTNHYVMLELKQNLIGLYAQLAPNKKNLSRKIELCQQILEVITKLEPGISRLRAITLYQLQSACVDLAHKLYANNDIDIEDLIGQLSVAEKYLKLSVNYLLYEPTQSPEGGIAQMAISELKMLRLSIGNIQRDYLDSKNNPRLSSRKSSSKGVNKKCAENEAAVVSEKENDVEKENIVSSRKGSNRRNKKRQC